MNKFLLILIIFIGCILNGYAQLPYSHHNFIKNGSFEEGSQPCLWAQLHKADFWESDTDTDNWFHSPDYYDQNQNFAANSAAGSCQNGTGGGAAQAGTKYGNRYIGMATYEVVSQKVLNLLPNTNYTFSMFVKTNDQLPNSWAGNGRVKVMMSKNKIKYQSDDINKRCMTEYVSHAVPINQEIRTFYSEILYLNDYPLDEWKRISFSFYYTQEMQDAGIDWINIEVEQVNYTDYGAPVLDCFSDYLYIDNVSLVRAEQCMSPCSPELENIVITSAIPNVLTICSPFYFTVKNAIGIKFTMINENQSNHIIHHEFAFDPNGLIDAGFDDYLFFWNGLLPGGVFEIHGIYKFEIEIWNCNETIIIGNDGPTNSNFMHYMPPSQTTCSIQYAPNIINYTLNDCCDEYELIQNTNFNTDNYFYVHDYIRAGNNVNPSLTQGNVTVSSGTKLYLQAGNSISLEPGFIALPGSMVDLVIDDCIYPSLNKSHKNRIRPEENLFENQIENSVDLLRIFPNPSENGIFRLNSSVEITNIEILGILGNRLKIIEGHQTEINISEYPKGVYLIKINDVNGSKIFKINYQ